MFAPFLFYFVRFINDFNCFVVDGKLPFSSILSTRFKSNVKSLITSFAILIALIALSSSWYRFRSLIIAFISERYALYSSSSQVNYHDAKASVASCFIDNPRIIIETMSCSDSEGFISTRFSISISICLILFGSLYSVGTICCNL